MPSEGVNKVELVLGGARSGKSRYAEGVASASCKPVVYIATSEVRDDEMAKRVQLHQQQRPKQWTVVEEPYGLADALRKHSHADNCVLVDCLTLWLSNSLFGQSQQAWTDIRQDFLQALLEVSGQVLLVSNEVGCGVVPMGKETRQFVDEAGWLHQAIAQQVAKVTLVTAGLPMTLKGGES